MIKKIKKNNFFKITYIKYININNNNNNNNNNIN